MALDYEAMLDGILSSEFAKDWVKDRKADLTDEIDFYGHELSEKQWKENLVSNFFEQTWKDIYGVLPEIWDEIKGIVNDELHWTVFEKAEDFEDYVDSTGWGERITIPFNLGEYLGDLEKEIHLALDKRFQGEGGV